MKLTVKLTLIFLLLSTVPLSLVGYLAYADGRRAIEQVVINRLLTTTILKKADFVRWLDDSKGDIRALAAQPGLQQYAAVLVSQDPASPEYQAAYEQIRQNRFVPYLQEQVSFLDFSLIRARDGLILVSTHEGLEGKYRESETFFIEGQQDTYVGNVEYEVTTDEQVMHISTPVMDEAGTVIAVLVSHLNLADISDIMGRRSGLRKSEETYLVNTFNFMVTESLNDPQSSLRRSVYTDGVNDCLAGHDGSDFYDDYRGMPVIGAYQWISERGLCIVTEVDQSEAFQPVVELRDSVLLIGVVIGLGVIGIGVFFARTITTPVQQLVRGTEEIGRGNLNYRIAVRGKDEIGQLAGAFNQMAANLKQSLGETAYNQRMLLALSQAAQAVQRARTSKEIYHSVGHQITALGYHVIVFMLTSDHDHLVIDHVTFDSNAMKDAETLAGASPLGHSFVIAPGSVYDQAIHQRQPVFCPDAGVGMGPALPEPARPASERLAVRLGLKETIYTPLTVGGEICGLLAVTGIGLTEADVPAVSAFANQVGIALENAHLVEDIRRHAENLEELVTERTVELRQEKQLSDDIVNGLPGVFYMIDEAGALIRWNEQFEDVTGYSAGELTSKPVVDLFAGDDKTLIAGRMQDVFVQGVAEAEADFVAKDGSKIPYYFTGLRIVLDGKTYLMGVGVDITERKQAEEAVRALSTRQEAILAAVPDVIVEVDNDKVYTWANRAGLEFFGEDVIGKEAAFYFEGEQDTYGVVQPLLNGIAEGVIYVESWQRRKDGEKRLLAWWCRALKDENGTVTGALSSARDITASRQAEEAVRRHAERLAAINRLDRVISSGLDIVQVYDNFVKEMLALIPVDRTAIVLLDETGDRWQIARQWTQYEPVFVPNVWRPVPGSVIEWLVTNRVPFLEQEIGEHGDWSETELVKREGIQSRLLLPLIIQEQVVGVLSTASRQPNAISEEDQSILTAIADQLAIAIQNSRLYAEVQRHAAELEQRVTERTAQLEASNKELEAFSYSVSHDLRAPLRAMDGFSRILLDEYAPDLPDEAQRYLGMVRDNARQMGNLIDHLLAFSRLGRQSLKKERVAPADLVQDALADLSPNQEGRKVEITVGDLPPCQADPALLRQVFANLLGNALKFTKTRNPAIIEVGYDNHTDEPVYFVKDNGVGFDMQYANKLFGVFQRLHRAEDYEGTGVGLATVQRIIHRHGGRIWVEAEVDKGAIFYFTLKGDDSK